MTGASAGFVASGSAAFTATVPATLYGSGSGATSSGSVLTGSATVTVSGGVGGLTYAWSYVSGSSGITITTPTAVSTTFSATVAGIPKEALYRCVVTDSLGHTVTSGTVDVTLEWIDTR